MRLRGNHIAVQVVLIVVIAAIVIMSCLSLLGMFDLLLDALVGTFKNLDKVL